MIKYIPMKKIITLVFTAILLFSWTPLAKGQMMNYGATNTPGTSNDKTSDEEARGKMIWERFKAKEVICSDLSDNDFDALGEYFMGQMMGTSHAAMNVMMAQMMGEQGETQMHIVMGKRLSGCDTSAVYPAGGLGFMPMMQMMSGFGSAQNQENWSTNGKFNLINTMMNFGFLALLFVIIWWVIVIAVIIVFLRWIIQKFKGGSNGESPLDVLKERYAKGEIDKKEFQGKKKDLEL